MLHEPLVHMCKTETDFIIKLHMCIVCMYVSLH